MNLSSSQIDSFYSKKPDSFSLLPTGLDDKSLIDLKENPLAAKWSPEIQLLLTKLTEDFFKRNEILAKLIKVTISYQPKNRAEFLWYLKLTVTVLLLKDLPLSFCVQQGHLLTKLSDIPTTLWDGSPLKIHYFASDLYEICENDLNMMFIGNQIASRSRLGLYMSLVMLWKSLYRCIDEEKDVFRLYPPSNLLEITSQINFNQLETDLEKFYIFLSLFSNLANLIFHRKSRFSEYTCFKEFFEFDEKLVTSLRTFLEQVMVSAETVFRRNNENLNILTLIEFLQNEISELDILVHSFNKLL